LSPDYCVAISVSPGTRDKPDILPGNITALCVGLAPCFSHDLWDDDLPWVNFGNVVFRIVHDAN